MHCTGLRSERLRPFWLAAQKLCRREIALIEELCRIFLVPSGYQPNPDYRWAVRRCLSADESLCVPFYGTYVQQMRALLANLPGALVVPDGPLANHAPEFINLYQGIVLIGKVHLDFTYTVC